MTQRQSHNIKQFANKILVAILCIISFTAGYFAHQSRQVNYCQSLNQMAKIKDTVVHCVTEPQAAES